ncbi:hypothetical protein [Mycolicibacterium frederiksbergense]|nr:hypothetical protein [Mycolicibacterium frederiksbergense]
MHPTEAINLAERVLRELIREIKGDDWKSHPTIDVQQLEQKRGDDLRKRRGVFGTDDLINFLEFYHLRDIIEKNWSQFEAALGKKKYFTVYMDRLEGFRNPVMHSRELRPFEVQLVHGIVGEIMNLVTEWRSVKGPDMTYYPLITQVTDSFGNVLESGHHTGVKLRPGQEVTFRCVGTDPQARELSWELRAISKGGSMIMVDAEKGNDVTLTWHVEEQHVREGAYINIQMSSDGDYHRDGEIDAQFTSRYDVLPPLDDGGSDIE